MDGVKIKSGVLMMMFQFDVGGSSAYDTFRYLVKWREAGRTVSEKEY
jgi:hypothetical protein